ncbi:Cytokinin 7-beta-glucosyltransferase [Bertholletia excelsa]
METPETQGRRWVVLVVCPLQGHITPMLELAGVLHSAGFSIMVAHPNLNSPDSTKHPDFVFLPLSDGLDNRNQIDTSTNFRAFIRDLNSNCTAPLQESLAREMERMGPHDRFACIIFDTMVCFAEDVANQLKLPSVILRIGSAMSTLSYVKLPWLHRQGILPLKGI